jgi:hypothetical protein
MEKDFAQYLAGLRARVAESEEVSKLVRPERQVRPRHAIEARPDYHQRQVEREGRSEWSGSTWGGRGR